uniref:Uncharacterized protein n=1 Tax=Anguilla anguilla TaxID=7936 RepID=A0A0E9RQ23_ANGAN
MNLKCTPHIFFLKRDVNMYYYLHVLANFFFLNLSINVLSERQRSE